MPTVYALCDRTHISLYPWLRAGFDCVAIDTQEPVDPNDGVTHLQCDILSINHLPDAAFVLAFPPCTHLCASGARWWSDKGQSALDEALAIVSKCVSLIGTSRGVMENPVGRLSKHYRPFDVKVHPYEFDALTTDDDSYSKATCLWLFNGANAPRKHRSGMPIDTTRIHHASPSDRGNIRSVTPGGLSNALFLSNVNYMRR